MRGRIAGSPPAGRSAPSRCSRRSACSTAPAPIHWIGYGVCLKLRGAFAEAAMAFEIAGRLRPDWAMPDFHTLEIALRTRDFTAAAEHLKNFDAHAGAGDIPDAVRAEVSRWRVALEMRARRAGSSA